MNRLVRVLLIVILSLRLPLAQAEVGSGYLARYQIRIYEFTQNGIPDSFHVNHGSLYPPPGWVVLTDSATGENFIANYKGLRTDAEDGSRYMYFENITPVKEGDGIPGMPGGSGPGRESAPLVDGKISDTGGEPTVSNKVEITGKSLGDQMLDGLGGAARAGAAAGAIAGITNEIANRWIITEGQRADWAAAQSASNYQGSLIKHQQDFVGVADGKLNKLEGELFKFDANLPQIDAAPHVFQSSDPKLVKDLTDLQNQLIYAPSLHPQAEELRGLGLGFVEQSDTASVDGDAVSAEVFEEYAKLTADLLVGLDPFTGTARSIYEAFTGNNLITGEALSEFERGVAVFGTVTFGYGQKISKGVSSIYKATKAMASRLKFVKMVSLNNSWVKAMKSGVFRMDAKTVGQFERFKFMMRSETNSFSKPFTGLAQSVLDKDPTQLFRYSDLAFETRGLKVPLRYSLDATQELSQPALDTFDALRKGDRVVVRQGVRGESKIALGGAKPQYWAHDQVGLGTSDFSHRMGAYSEVPDFVEYGQIKQGAKYVVREAKPGKLPDGRITPGGGMEVVVELDGVNPLDFKLLPR